jgi:hypothetical protein
MIADVDGIKTSLFGGDGILEEFVRWILLCASFLTELYHLSLLFTYIDCLHSLRRNRLASRSNASPVVSRLLRFGTL